MEADESFKLTEHSFGELLSSEDDDPVPLSSDRLLAIIMVRKTRDAIKHDALMTMRMNNITSSE